jgi:hypothetical protein
MSIPGLVLVQVKGIEYGLDEITRDFPKKFRKRQFESSPGLNIASFNE